MSIFKSCEYDTHNSRSLENRVSGYWADSYHIGDFGRGGMGIRQIRFPRLVLRDFLLAVVCGSSERWSKYVRGVLVV